MIREHALRLYNRLRLYSDVRHMLLILRFRELRKEFYDDLWAKAAGNVGAEYSPWKFGYTRIRRDGLTTVVSRGRVMLDDPVTLNVFGNKVLTYELMTAKGVKIPRYCVFGVGSSAKAKQFLAEVGAPVVVKPAGGTGGGQGVMTGITNTADLVKACRYAARFAARSGSELLVEEHVAGESYRLLFIGGEFVDAIRRCPPSVTGDGKQGLRALVAAENQRRLKERPITALSPLVFNKDCINRLAAQGLAANSVLKAGQSIAVKQAINENAARDNHNVKGSVHPDIIETGSRLAKDLGVRFAGLDLISTDVSAPLSEGKCIFSEINTTPGIHHHYLLSDPATVTPVAELVLEYIFSTRQGVMVL